MDLKKIKFTLILIMLASLFANSVVGQALEKPGPKATCPVCGMFVGLYPDWTALVVSEDGSRYFFDGSKDMFKFILDTKKWAPHIKNKNFITFQVTDYYNLQELDAEKAFYVIGSDILGPMGHELIPLRTKEEALEFLFDHKGERIFKFNDITNQLLERLDAGIFKLEEK